MRYRLRTLLIVLLALAIQAAVVCCAVHYARPLAEAASDYVIEVGARAVYRGVCYRFTLE